MRNLVFALALFVPLCLQVKAQEIEVGDNPLIGQWVDQLPDGAAMITEFSSDSVSFWSIGPNGAQSAVNTAPINFEARSDGAVDISIAGQGDTALTVVVRGVNTIELIFPGMSSRRLSRYQQ